MPDQNIPPRNLKKVGTETCTVRLGELKQAAETRAADEGLKNISVLIRTAVRLYLADTDKADLVHLEILADEIRDFRSDFSRVGGNLNQIALAFNKDDVLSESTLKMTHRSLQRDFKKLAEIMKEIQNVAEAFRR